jgi:hypothetical protein
LVALTAHPGAPFTNPRPKVTGACALCGRHGPLTFEHVPPLAAFNNYPVVRQSYADFLARREPVEQRRGRGDYVFCGRCNNFTGAAYGAAFADWVKQGLELAHHQRGRPTMNYFGIIQPLRVAKQIVSMFIATGGETLRLAHPELAKFVLELETRGLPPQYQLYSFWMGRGSLRQTGMSIVGQWATGATCTLAEVVHPPFGYVLECAGRMADRRPTAITDFCVAYDINETVDLRRRLPVLPTLWMGPGDYRDQDQIDRDVITNALLEWVHESGKAEARAGVLFDRYGHPLAERLSPGHW